MGVDLYALRKRAVMVLAPSGIRETVYFLQLAVEHALSPDSQNMVDAAVKYAYKEWEDHSEFPKLCRPGWERRPPAVRICDLQVAVFQTVILLRP